MKQKYLILNDKKNKQIKIQEFAELNKQMLSLLCEETYDHKTPHDLFCPCPIEPVQERLGHTLASS